MKKTKKNTYPHTKIVLAGFLTTNSLVRGTAEILYRKNYSTQKERDKAVMAYLYSLGVPGALAFADFSNLFETVFPPLPLPPKSTFPIFLDYDQDNCYYSVLVSGAKILDEEATA